MGCSGSKSQFIKEFNRNNTLKIDISNFIKINKNRYNCDVTHIYYDQVNSNVIIGIGYIRSSIIIDTFNLIKTDLLERYKEYNILNTDIVLEIKNATMYAN
jgi:hypothetical protein